MRISKAHSLTHTHTHSYPLRVLSDPLAPPVPLVRMVLVDSVEILVPLVNLESRVWLDHLVHLERRDHPEKLVHL